MAYFKVRICGSFLRPGKNKHFILQDLVHRSDQSPDVKETKTISQTFFRVGLENLPNILESRSGKSSQVGKSSKHCWEQVRKNLPTDLVKNDKPTSRASAFRTGFHWPTLTLLAGLYLTIKKLCSFVTFYVLSYLKTSPDASFHWSNQALLAGLSFLTQSVGRFFLTCSEQCLEDFTDLWGFSWPALQNFGRFHWPVMSFKYISAMCCLEDN